MTANGPATIAALGASLPRRATAGRRTKGIARIGIFGAECRACGTDAPGAAALQAAIEPDERWSLLDG